MGQRLPRLPVLALACTVAFAVLALQVLMLGPLARLDEAITLHLASRRADWLTTAMQAVSLLHRTLPVLAATAALALWRGMRRDREGVALMAVVPTGMLLNVGLKNLFQRLRPMLEDPLVHLTTYSFPSGHAVAATVFYGAACTLVFLRVRSAPLRALAAFGAAAMVLLVAFSRIYLGAHYLSDVLAGMAVGMLWLLLALWVLRSRGA